MCPHCIATFFIIFGGIVVLVWKHICLACKMGFHKWDKNVLWVKGENELFETRGKRCECCNKVEEVNE